jgi:site-specific DNA-methyltransferase (adenine-specific)
MTVLVGDCREVMRTMADNSVDAIVTDPPYELGFMGKSWDSTGVAYDVTVWQECLRVLKPGGHLLAFGGSRTYHRLAVAIEDAGFQIRDQIMWVYGSGFPKSLNVGKQDGCQDWQGWGTALKPAHEPIVMARKPLDGTVANNVLTHGVGGINIDGCRVGEGTGETKTVQYPDIRGNNYNNASGTVEYTVKNQGRFPANFIHDGSEEVLELFPDSKAGEPRNDRGTGGIWLESMGVPCGPQYGDNGSAARFFYCAKASKKDRNEGLDDFPLIKGGSMNGAETRPDKPTNHPIRANHHPTVKPTELMRYLCRLVTPPNGTVLDPFLGSGSTGKAATLERVTFIGIEQSAEYAEIANARINHAKENK